MTSETTTELDPGDVFELARQFFIGPDPVREASLAQESDTHLTFETFRSRIVVAAFPDPRGEAATRVRVSTLREYDVASRFLTYLRTAPAAAPDRARAAAE